MSNNQQGDYLPPNAVVRQKNPRVKIHHGYWLFLRPYVVVGAGGGAVVGVGGYFAARSATAANWPEDATSFLYHASTFGALVGIVSACLLVFFWFFPWNMRGARKSLGPDEISQLRALSRRWDRLAPQIFEEMRDRERNYLYPGISRIGVGEGCEIFIELSMPEQRPPGGREAYLEKAAAELRSVCNFAAVEVGKMPNRGTARLVVVVDDESQELREWEIQELH
jgi:hypothetical protein